MLDENLTLEVRGLERAPADEALRAAVGELRELEPLLDPDGDAAGGIGALDAAAGGEPVALDPRVVELLQRALSFCAWSDGAQGPLGGELYALWGLGGFAAGRPAAGRLEQAADNAECSHLRIDSRLRARRSSPPARASSCGASRAASWSTARWRCSRSTAPRTPGWSSAGCGGRSARGTRSPEEAGRGWPVTLPVFPGQDRPLDRVWLRDEALAVASAVHRPLLAGGDRYAPYLDQRNGKPAEGVTGVVTVTETALDAEGLAASLMIFGNREGLLRLGSLKPSPAVLWLLGGGDGAPLLAQHDWSRIALR